MNEIKFNTDFLTGPAAQLKAVQDLAELQTQLVDLQTEVLVNMHERRALIQSVAGKSFSKKPQWTWAAAIKSAEASAEVKEFDQEKRPLTKRIQLIKIEIERYRLSIEVAIARRAARVD